MATKGSSQKNRVADPNKTKNGRTRLGPLNFKQLTDMLAKSSRPKERAKIQRRIQTLVQRGQVPMPVVVVVEETTAE
jgi:hypothetical protein